MDKPNKFYQQCLTEVQRVVNNALQTVDGQRKLARHKYSFSQPAFAEQILIWDYIWKNARNSWTKLQAYLFCEKYAGKVDELSAEWDTLKTWQDSVARWGECEALAKLYTKILEIVPAKVYPVLKQWNKSSNQWMRRQSVVSLLYFQRTKKKFLPFQAMLPLIDNLLDDKEYYVQKGVGWAIKELSQVYPKQTFEDLKKNIKSIKPTAFTHTCEKLSTKQKQELKALRK